MFRRRQPTLTKSVEETLKKELKSLWSSGLSGKDIAEALNFGDEGPYKKLKLFHVYYYRTKFKLPPRVKRQTGVSRYKHKPDSIKPLSPNEVYESLNKVYRLNHPIKSIAKQSSMARAFLWLLYYTPLRKSEIYERSLNDFKIAESKDMGKYILIDLYRKKKIVTEKKPAIKAPFYLSLDSPHSQEVLDWLLYRMTQVKRAEEENASIKNDKDKHPINRLVFPLSSWQAWDTVKRAFPESYPHYYRFRYITDRASNPMIPIEDLLVETDLNIVTLRRYMMTGERQRRLAFMRRRASLRSEP